MDVFEAIYSRRSIREYKPERVPEWKLEKILDAARWAPSPENSQLWRFIIIKDPEMKDLLDRLAQTSASAAFGAVSYDQIQDRLWYLPPYARPAVIERIYDGSLLSYHREADVSIACCRSVSHHDFPLLQGEEMMVYSGFPLAMATQNMWLAATALGLGMGFNQAPVGDERYREFISESLGIPPGWRMEFVLALGVPKFPRGLGPSRFPLEAIAYEERWGRHYKRMALRR